MEKIAYAYNFMFIQTKFLGNMIFVVDIVSVIHVVEWFFFKIQWNICSVDKNYISPNIKSNTQSLFKNV